MNRFATAAAAAILIAGPAFAIVDFEAVDTDGDDFIRLPEALAAYPEMDPTDFDRIDVDENRLIDPSEAASAEGTAIFDGLARTEGAGSTADFDMAEYDTDGDTMMSYSEVVNRVPDVPQAYFQDFDLDNNGMLDSSELASGSFINLLNKYGS